VWRAVTEARCTATLAAVIARFVVLPALLSAAICQSPASNQVPVDFTREIRPILSQHCFACHGPDRESREAKLSFVTFEDATKAREDGAAIVPGNRQNSRAWLRITDADSPMPPTEAHNPMTAEQVELFGRWIDEGASYSPHWAYVTPAVSEPPEVREKDWPLTAVDRYILARLEAEGLPHAADADPVTLVRRATLDLTGLPPSAEEVAAFVLCYKNEPEAAYDALLDRLLASHHYGERMATPWLDLVRYADTVGYHGDQEHNIWPYREWVIRAFSENKPFDQFTIEQLAGDLLAKPTQDQLIATGYNRLLQTTHEGGLQLGEYRAIYQADRVRNASAVWMGATLGCAQCHDHKYDPYTMRDFYAFGAFFADIDDEDHLRNPYGGLNSTPTKRVPEMRVSTAASEQERLSLDKQRAIVAAERKQAKATLAARREAWERDLREKIAKNGTRHVVWVDDQLDTGGDVSGSWQFTSDGPEPHSGTKTRVQKSGGLVQHYTVKTERRIEVAAGDVFYAWVHLDAAKPAKAVMLQFHKNGDWSHRAVWGNNSITYGRQPKSHVGHQRMGKLPVRGRWERLEVAAEQVGLKPGDVVSGWAFTQFGGVVHWDDCGVRTSVAPDNVVAALQTKPGERLPGERKLLSKHHQETDAVLHRLRARKAALDAQSKQLEKQMPLTLYTRALPKPREVKILPRGNWLDESGDAVQPAIPAFLGAVGNGGRAGRMELARWLVDDKNGVGGLTARVFVNRIWAMFFGVGLCPSTEDFGGQGTPPNHLQLLDRLALDFVASGWDVKALVRRIVASRTYRQSSVAPADVVTRDPLNELYGRQSRQRLPAEMIRDVALSVSGLLVDRMGGPSAKPPQPAGYYRHLNFPTRRYQQDKNDARYRRGVYVHWQRQFLHPMMRAFDAPTREECTAQRPISNTPLAALTLLNDPVFVEAARAFAQRALQIDTESDAMRIAWAMREATARVPKAAESQVLLALLQASRKQYQKDGAAAKKLLAVGDSPRDASLAFAEHAAWTQVMRAILNLHETICRD